MGKGHQEKGKKAGEKAWGIGQQEEKTSNKGREGMDYWPAGGEDMSRSERKHEERASGEGKEGMIRRERRHEPSASRRRRHQEKGGKA